VIVLWTNHYAEGRPHGFTNIPHIIWGSGGGYLKQGQYVDAGDTTNNRLLDTLISAAIQDTHTIEEDFGDGARGMLDVVRSGK